MSSEERRVPWSGAMATSIDAFYAGERDHDQGRAACEHLLSRADLPDHIRALTERNQTFYARPLAELAPSVAFTRVPRLVEPGWSWFNPSIAAEGSTLHVLVRSSNYAIQPGRRYAVFDRAGVVRSRYYHLRLGDDLRLRGMAPVETSDLPDPAADFPVRGYEDCRLIRFGSRWLATATTRDHNPAGVCQQVLLHLEDDRWVGRQILSDPESGHQKNWIPFVVGADLLVVQRCHPMTVLRIDPDRGRHELVVRHETTPLARSFRGGSQGVSVHDGWLFVVHEAVDHGPERRTYLHRLILLDRDYRLTHVSPQLYFSRKGIEYCAGMVRHGDDVLLAIGIDDQEAWIARLPLGDALGLLRPVGSSDAPSPGVPGICVAPDGGPARAGIVSTTLAGPGSERLIGDALRSVVAQVDRCLVVDTGIGDDGLAAARQVAGDRLLVRRLTWPGDFADARNTALRYAAETGSAWAVTVDTDERLHLDGLDLHAILAHAPSDVLAMPYRGGGYSKPRIFRLPAGGAWVGATHEYFDLRSSTQSMLSDGVFTEVPKSDEDLRAKLERDLELLRGLTARYPHASRWWYYLGDTLRNLGDVPGAIVAFDRCASVDGWAEEAAWSRYQEAVCWLTLGMERAAVRACATGLACHPGVAELAWLAGFASWRAQRYEDAVWWSELAIVHGAASEGGASPARTGFRNPMALYEGPYDVLRHALRALNRGEDAERAERQFEAAKRLRSGAEAP